MDNDDSDDTPRTYVTDAERAQHYAAYPPGALVIGESRPTPRNLFELELQERVKSLEDSRKFWRRIATIVLPILLTGFGGFVLYSADKISTSSERIGNTLARLDGVVETVRDLQKGAAAIGGMEARIDALFKLLNMLEEDIRELRKHAGIAPKPIVDGRVGANP